VGGRSRDGDGYGKGVVGKKMGRGEAAFSILGFCLVANSEGNSV